MPFKGNLRCVCQACFTAALGICMPAQAEAPLPAAAQAALPWPADIRFRILDGDKAVGESLTHIAGDRDSFVVTTTTRVSAETLLLKAVVEERLEERWVKGRFESLSSDVRTSGVFGTSHKTLAVSRTAEGALKATTGDGSHALPADAVPLTFWGAPVVHDGAFFDIADGQLAKVLIAPAGSGAGSRSYQGRSCVPQQMLVDGPQKTQMTVWLDSDGSLCGLRQHTPFTDLSYERQEPPHP
jgi:hypothetical protein